MQRKLWKWLVLSVIPGVLAGVAVLFLYDRQYVILDSISGWWNNFTLPNMRTSYKDVVFRAAPAVVNIFVNNNDSEKSNVHLGSGVIVSANGVVLTNNHVIDGVESIVIEMKSGKEYIAEVVGQDPETDLAVLKIDTDHSSYIRFSDSIGEVGDIVLAIGNPFGLGQTVTLGIISAIGRNNLQLNTYEDYIQTDAAINIGNSGGALININGELLGISTLLFSKGGGNEGVGFVIPSDMLQFVARQILKHGIVVRGWLGLESESLTKALAQSLDLDSKVGIVITKVFKDSPAYKIGLKRGDILVAVNDESASDGRNIMNIIAEKVPGEIVKLTVIRGNEKKNMNVKLSVRPNGYK